MIKAGTTASEMVLNVDVAPTILDIAGVPVYDAMDGVSFKSLLQGKKIESILKGMSMLQDTAMEREPIMIT